MAALLQGHIDDEIAEVDSIKKDIQDTIKHVEDMCNSLGLEAELVIPRPTIRFTHTHTCAQTGCETPTDTKQYNNSSHSLQLIPKTLFVVNWWRFRRWTAMLPRYAT